MTVTELRPVQPGAPILNEIRAHIARFVSHRSDTAYDTMTLWVAHTHAVGRDQALVFDATPRLALLSTGPESGKTVALDTVCRLARNGTVVAETTGPSMVQLINDERATVGVDEIDLLFGPGNGQRQIRAILNAGAYRTGKVSRMRKQESCFGPVALAGMRQNFCANPYLTATKSRSIMITMRPQRGGTVERYRPRVHGSAAGALREALAGWVASRVDTIAAAFPDMPDGVDNRLEDMWTPLLAVADAAGGDWPERARAACATLGQDADDDSDPVLSPAQQLLADLARVWGEGEDQIGTGDILRRLATLPGQDYWPHGVSIEKAAAELSRTLRPLGIRPVKLWRGGHDVQGYRFDDLAEHMPEIEETERVDPDAPELAEVV